MVPALSRRISAEKHLHLDNEVKFTRVGIKQMFHAFHTITRLLECIKAYRTYYVGILESRKERVIRRRLNAPLEPQSQYGDNQQVAEVWKSLSWVVAGHVRIRQMLVDDLRPAMSTISCQKITLITRCLSFDNRL